MRNARTCKSCEYFVSYFELFDCEDSLEPDDVGECQNEKSSTFKDVVNTKKTCDKWELWSKYKSKSCDQ